MISRMDLDIIKRYTKEIPHVHKSEHHISSENKQITDRRTMKKKKIRLTDHSQKTSRIPPPSRRHPRAPPRTTGLRRRRDPGPPACATAERLSTSSRWQRPGWPRPRSRSSLRVPGGDARTRPVWRGRGVGRRAIARRARTSPRISTVGTSLLCM